MSQHSTCWPNWPASPQPRQTTCRCCCCRASQDSWAAHHARLLIRLEQQLEDIDAADADAKAASAAAQATITALHAQERQQLQYEQQQMECLIEQLEQQVQQLERDGMVKQQQQEELTSMCAQVSWGRSSLHMLQNLCRVSAHSSQRSIPPACGIGSSLSTCTSFSQLAGG